MIGVGAMIRPMGGNENTIKSLQSATGKQIAGVYVDETGNKWKDPEDGCLVVYFTDGDKLEIYDAGRSCCESRWMHTDDDLDIHAGETFLGVWINGEDVLDEKKDNEDYYNDYPHQVQFLQFRSTRGTSTIETHNQHNGYYGGFWVMAVYTKYGETPDRSRW